MSSVNPAPRGAGRVSALSWLALKARALRRYGPGFAVEVVIFWVMLEGFQQLNYGGRIITGPQSRTVLVLSLAFVVVAMGAAAARFGLYRRIWKVAGIHDAIATGFAVIEASLLITLANWAMPGDYRVFRLAVPLLAAPAALMGIGIFRLLPRLLSRTPATGSRLLIVPGGGHWMHRHGVARLRQLSADDLVGRTHRELEVAQARDQVAGKTVLVTGAAGSIGSELCRLLAGLAPARLVLVDNNESGLFDIAEELRMAMSIDIREALISITEREQLLELFAEERPELVFHAAAYKHVPMMEMHPAQAVMTNVIGTYNTLRCAEAAGVQSFVLISTDQAVARHPVMGCTKRLCEQMILGWRGEMTCWAVRFGNVVGSRGSVVPLFERQIELGGPVTITHPEMTRYMMTIREAVSLVIKTLTVAKAGHVYMLDMGEPMKIVSLAEALVRARGLRPGEDIEIVYTGLRA